MTQHEDVSLISELEVRQDQVLRELDELNARIEQVIGQFNVRPSEDEPHTLPIFGAVGAPAASEKTGPSLPAVKVA